MATGSMMAWRWKRRSRTTQRLIILALLAVIGAAAVAVVVDITRTDLGWWVLPAWLILILGALWGAIQAVPVQRIIQRRAASQAGQAIEAVVPTAGGGSS
jgi:Na+-translocating ferredoxin:NAD+ oxidoreductase RnfG subunit